MQNLGGPLLALLDFLGAVVLCQILMANTEPGSMWRLGGLALICGWVVVFNTYVTNKPMPEKEDI